MKDVTIGLCQFRWTCFSGGEGRGTWTELDDLQGSLPNPAILWFCNLFALKIMAEYKKYFAYVVQGASKLY